MRIHKQVIQLNADMQILSIISMKKAICKIMSNKARMILQDENKPFLHPFLDFKPPIIIALKKFIYVPFISIRITRKNILARDQYICQYCGINLGKGTSTTIDHVIPRSRKNSPGNTWENLVACCQKCNNLKDNKTPSEAGMSLIKIPIRPNIEDLLISDRFLREKYESFLKNIENR
jgi:hypothetical protein